jgi:hypothetical protein
MGPQEDFETIGLYEGDDILNLSKKITERIKNMKTEKNLIFTDLFGPRRPMQPQCPLWMLTHRLLPV